jgi:hypothetical protein
VPPIWSIYKNEYGKDDKRNNYPGDEESVKKNSFVHLNHA